MLPHVLFTSDAEWNPFDFDNEPDDSLFHDAFPFPDNYVVDDPMLDDMVIFMTVLLLIPTMSTSLIPILF